MTWVALAIGVVALLVGGLTAATEFSEVEPEEFGGLEEQLRNLE